MSIKKINNMKKYFQIRILFIMKMKRNQKINYIVFVAKRIYQAKR